MPEKITVIILTFFCIQFSSFSQKNYSWELEAGVLASNRLLSARNMALGDYYYFNKVVARSEVLPGGYIQTGVNFRHDKRFRPFMGIRLMNQQVQLIDVSMSASIPAVYLGTFKADMLYLNFPLSVKYDLIQKPNYRLTTEFGLLPGILVCVNAPENMNEIFQEEARPDGTKLVNLSSELSLIFERKLKSGNSIAFRFPCFNIAVTPNSIAKDGAASAVQHNYSLGLGIKFVFPGSE